MPSISSTSSTPSTRSLARRIVAAASVTGFGSVATMLLTTLAGIAVAREGGPQGYAVFVAANMLVFVSSVLFSCSLPLALARHVAGIEETAATTESKTEESGASQRARDEVVRDETLRDETLRDETLRDETLRHNGVRRVAAAALWLTALVALAGGALVALNLPRLEAHLQLVIGSGFAWAFPLALLGAMTADCAIGIYLGLLRPRSVMLITASGPLLMLGYLLLRRVAPQILAGPQSLAPQLPLQLPLWGAVVASYGGSGLMALAKLRRDRLLGFETNADKMSNSDSASDTTEMLKAVETSRVRWMLDRRARLLILRPVFRGMALALAFTYFTIFSTWSDRWIVGTQLGAAPFGLYAAAAAIIQAALRVPTNIATMLVPASAKVALHGAAKSARLNGAAIGAFALFAALMIVTLLLAGPLVVRLLFGPRFASAAAPLLLMTPSLAAAAISIPLLSALTGAGWSERESHPSPPHPPPHQPHQSKSQTSSAAEAPAEAAQDRPAVVTNSPPRRKPALLWLGLSIPLRVLLLLLFTARWGLAGTACATALSDVLLAAGCILTARRAGMPFPLRALTWPAAIGATAYAAGSVSLALGAHPLLAVVAAGAVFAPALWRAARPLPMPAVASASTPARAFDTSRAVD